MSPSELRGASAASERLGEQRGAVAAAALPRADRRREPDRVPRRSARCRASRRPSTAPIAAACGCRAAPASLELRPADGYIRARYWLEDLRDLAAAIQRSRALLDLDSDPQGVARRARRRPAARRARRALAPGRRVAGHVDGHELAIRAVLGQQVSLRGAATLAARLVRAHGEPLERPLGAVTHLFPPADALADADPARLAMPRSRAARAARARGRARGRRARARHRRRARRTRAAAARAARGSGRGPPSTSRCARCAIPTRSCPRDLGVRHALERLGQDGRAVGGRRARRALAPVPRIRRAASLGVARSSRATRREIPRALGEAARLAA